MDVFPEFQGCIIQVQKQFISENVDIYIYYTIYIFHIYTIYTLYIYIYCFYFNPSRVVDFYSPKLPDFMNSFCGFFVWHLSKTKEWSSELVFDVRTNQLIPYWDVHCT